MKKGSFFKSLPFKLLVAVILGILSGLVLNRYSTNGISMAVLNIVVTVKYILGQIITFCVPLIVLGFIAPSITKLGKNASVMLGVAVVLAYGSSIGAALFSTASGFFIIPHLSIHSYAAGLKQLPEVIFELEIPQIMSVMSALVFSVMIGLAATWTKAKLVTGLLDEFQKIVLALVSRIIIPILPLFIGSTFCGLAYEGTITRQLPVFLEIIVLVLAGHFIWMAFLYILAGIYSGENPLEVVRHYALAVALQCASRAKPLRKDLVNFGIPLFANIHLCGSVLTEVFFCMAVSKILYGSVPTPGTMVLFCLLLGVFAIGAPGVPGGTVMASLGIITGVLKFDSSGTALMLTIFALQDSFGTACNVTGDGALTLMLTGYAKRHNIEEQNIDIEL